MVDHVFRNQHLLQTEQELDFNRRMDMFQQRLVDAVIAGDSKSVNEILDLLQNGSFSDYMSDHLSITRLYIAGYLMELKRAILKAGLPGYIAEEFILHAYKMLSEADTTEKLRSVTVHNFQNLFALYQKNNLTQYSRTVRMAIDRIHMLKMQPLSAGDVARYLQVDSTYLARVFRAETGKTMTQYIQTVKCDAAEDMILRRNYSLHEIADLLGFSSYSYFSKVFKRVKGISPTQIV